METKEYTLEFTLENGHIYRFPKWYISPKKAIGSYRNSLYPQPFENFKRVEIVERTCIVSETKLDLKNYI